MTARWLRWLSCTLVVLVSACDGSGGGSPDGNTTWQKECRATANCAAGLSCLCGICTRACAHDTECKDLSRTAECFPPSTLGDACSASSPGAGLCLASGMDGGVDDAGPRADGSSGTSEASAATDASGHDVKDAQESGPPDSSTAVTADARSLAESGAPKTDASIGDTVDSSLPLSTDAGTVPVGQDPGPDYVDAGQPSCPDGDGDGVCDSEDVCPGYPDSIDTDGDGTPDRCEFTLLKDIYTGTEDSDVTTAILGASVYVAAKPVYPMPQGRLLRMDFAGSEPIDITPPLVPDSWGAEMVAGTGSRVYFFIHDPVGEEIWVVLREKAKPVRLVPTAPMSGRVLAATSAQDLLYFVLEGSGLWRTDGTDAGTVSLGSGPQDLYGAVSTGRSLFYMLGGANPDELWFSDGTPEGTHAVHSGVHKSSPPAIVTDRAYFVAEGTAFGPPEIWSTDGSPSGTTQLALTYPTGAVPDQIWPVGNRLLVDYYNATEKSVVVELVDTDGSNRTPLSLGAAAAYRTGGGTFAVTQDSVYRVPDTGVPELLLHGTSLEAVPSAAGLFVLDHCTCSTLDTAFYRVDANGATLIANGMDGPYPRMSLGYGGQVVGDRIAFPFRTAPYGLEPWISDGTTAGTRLLRDMNDRTADSSPYFLGSVNDVVAFSAASEVGCRQSDLGCHSDLWIGSPTGATHGSDQLAELKNRDYVTVWATLGDYLFLLPLNPVSPLYRMDASGRVIPVAGDVNGSGVTGMGGALPVGDHLVVVGSSGLWTIPTAALTDAAPSLASAAPLGAGPTAPFLVLEGNALGWAWVVDGNQHLWRTDGTVAGTVDVAAGVRSQPVVEFGSAALFVGTDGELFRTAGTSGDAVNASNFASLGWSVSVDSFLTVFAGRAYFNANWTGPGVNEGWYRSDGTTSEQVSSTKVVGNPVILNGRLLVPTYDTLSSLDGTGAWTLLTQQKASAATVAVSHGFGWFAGNDAAHGTELWRTDGTAEGTMMDADLEPGPHGSYPNYLFPTPNALYFSAAISPYGSEPWLRKF